MDREAETVTTSKLISDPDYIAKNFNIGKELGSGAYAQVRLLEDKESKKPYALKLIPNTNFITKTSLALGYYNREVNTLEKIQHPNLLKMVFHGKFSFDKLTSSVMTKESNCIVLEYMEHGCLFDYIISDKKGFNERIVRNMFSQILDAVGAIHSNGFAHGDLKTENILLDSDWTVKLCDFGNSYPTSDENFYVKSGTTKGYCPPEIVHNFNLNSLGDKSDIFSLGVILFILMTGSIPFVEASNNDRLYKKIKSNKEEDPNIWDSYNKLLGLTFSQDFKDLFLSMVHYLSEKRPNLEEIKKSKWMSGETATKEEVASELARRKKLL